MFLLPFYHRFTRLSTDSRTLRLGRKRYIKRNFILANAVLTGINILHMATPLSASTPHVTMIVNPSTGSVKNPSNGLSDAIESKTVEFTIVEGKDILVDSTVFEKENDINDSTVNNKKNDLNEGQRHNSLEKM